MAVIFPFTLSHVVGLSGNPIPGPLEQSLKAAANNINVAGMKEELLHNADLILRLTESLSDGKGNESPNPAVTNEIRAQKQLAFEQTNTATETPSLVEKFGLQPKPGGRYVAAKDDHEYDDRYDHGSTNNPSASPSI